MSAPVSPYLRHALRMQALCEPLRGLDARSLADPFLCRSRWRRGGFGEDFPDLEEQREARRRALIRLRLFPLPVAPPPAGSPALPAPVAPRVPHCANPAPTRESAHA